ncbi:MAG: hypothetical protein ONB46_04095 [candidate division KSB1 bacterium]|nr:hypothetical protein [candidate division KSB1 bacterium]MDZ7365199.1 hypothetical protein [candidate division KSB1 bacterium]
MVRRMFFDLIKRNARSSALRLFTAAVVLCGTVFLLNAVFFDVRPSNLWGLTYGTLAAILMIGAALLGLQRRLTKLALKTGFGNAQTWLHVHLYGGALFLLLTFMHTGFRQPHGILTWWLWFLSIWVTASGFFGVILQKWIPKLLTSGLAIEVVYERIPELIQEIGEQVEALMESCAPQSGIKDFYQKQIAMALVTPRPRLIYCIDITGGIQARLKQFEYLRGFLPLAEKENLNKLEALYKTKLEIDAHYTLQRLLRLWLYTHVPASLVLLVLLGLHLFAVLYY